MSMLKIIFLSCILFLGPIPSATASETQLEAPGFTVINYPSVVKIQKTPCQIINISYEIDSELDTDRAAMAISIGHINKKKVIGAAAWWGTKISNSETQLSMPLIGVLPIKVCKKSWTLGKRGSNQVYSYEVWYL